MIPETFHLKFKMNNDNMVYTGTSATHWKAKERLYAQLASTSSYLANDIRRSRRKDSFFCQLAGSVRHV